MNYSKQELIKYRLERAYETFDEAKILFVNEKWNAVVNRLYCACFYSVNALFLNQGIFSKTHSGTRNQFQLHFIKSNIIENHYGEFYSQIFDLRLSGDYQDMLVLTREKVEPLLIEAEAFLERIKLLIDTYEP
jgi:uncharacterized protein (UPF0332 family)